LNYTRLVVPKQRIGIIRLSALPATLAVYAKTIIN